MSSLNARAAVRRRWYVALACLLLTLGGVIVTTKVVPVKTEMSANVLLLPPKAPAGSPSGPTNPYLQLGGLNTIVGLVARALTAPSTAESMVAQGATGEVKVQPDFAMPDSVIMIVVGGKTPDEASRTLQVVLATLPHALAELQARVSTPPGSYVTSSVVNQDTQGRKVRTSQLRAVLVVGGGGATGTLLLTTLVDFFIMSRRRPKGSKMSPASREPVDEPLTTDLVQGKADSSMSGVGSAIVRPSTAQLQLWGFEKVPHLSPPSPSSATGRPVGQTGASLSMDANRTSEANGSALPHLIGQASEGEHEGQPLSLTPPDRWRSAVSADDGSMRADLNGHGVAVGPGQQGAAPSAAPSNDHAVDQRQANSSSGAASGERSVAVDKSVPGSQGLSARHASASVPSMDPNEEAGFGPAPAGALIGTSPACPKAAGAGGPGPAPEDPAIPAPEDPAISAGPPARNFDRLLRSKMATPTDPDPRAAAHRLP